MREILITRYSSITDSIPDNTLNPNLGLESFMFRLHPKVCCASVDSPGPTNLLIPAQLLLNSLSLASASYVSFNLRVSFLHQGRSGQSPRGRFEQVIRKRFPDVAWLPTPSRPYYHFVPDYLVDLKHAHTRSSRPWRRLVLQWRLGRWVDSYLYLMVSRLLSFYSNPDTQQSSLLMVRDI